MTQNPVLLTPKRRNPYALARSSSETARDTTHVTVVHFPGNSYGNLAESLENDIFRAHGWKVRHLIIEGNAPDTAKHRLEKASKRFADARILYTHHRPALTEAINMAMIHVTTPYIFFLAGDARLAAGTFEKLLQLAHASQADFAYPVISEKDKWTRPVLASLEQSLSFLDPRALFAKSAALRHLGELEECDWRISGVDLALSAQKHEMNLVEIKDVAFSMEPATEPTAADLELAKIQWNPNQSTASLARHNSIWSSNKLPNHYLGAITNYNQHIRSINDRSAAQLYSWKTYVKICSRLFAQIFRVRRPER